MITITINGEKKKIQSQMKLDQFIEKLGFTPKYCLVELNKKIIKQKRFSQILIKNDDRIELARIVAGG